MREYNDTYNNLRPRLFDGSHLDYPGMNQALTLRPHQNDAVWRGMSSGNTLLAHTVGAGKTFTMAATGMKMKQAGLIKKPMYVVPNHLLEQFSREFMQLYPNAKLLVAAKEDLTRERRKFLTAKIASGEWDGIIVTHSSFERIGMSRDYQEKFLREQIAEYDALLIEHANQRGASRNLIKTIEKQKAARAEGKLAKERIVNTWVSAHLTEPQKADATQYDSGDLLEVHQNAPGFKKGSRLIVSEKVKPPMELVNRFEAYRPVQLALAVGDRVRVTAGGKTKDGKHRLSNGSLFNVEGFTRRGDIVVDHGWIIDRDFGHLTHGYVVTSHASQGATVNKVFVGMSSESFPATNERTAYVTLTRGKEQVQVFTDDKNDLLKAMCREDDPLSATDIAEESKRKKTIRNPLALGRQPAGLAVQNQSIQMDNGRLPQVPELTHER